MKNRGNSIISGISGLISNIWSFGRNFRKKDNSVKVPDTDLEIGSSVPISNDLKNNTVVSDKNDKKIDLNVDITSNITSNITNKKRKKDIKKKDIMDFTMNNYLGVGVDGAVTLGFHSLRQKVPALFFSRWINKIWYGMISVRTLLLGWSRDLSQCCQLQCDGEIVKIPPGTQSIIILNINSYAGGMKMWPDASSPLIINQGTLS